MPDLLSPDPSGDLTALGISDRNPISEEVPEEVEEAQATAAEEVVEEVAQVEEPEAEAAEVVEEASLLAQLPEEQVETSGESEVDRLRREKVQLEAALRERRTIAEEQIRAAVPQEKPAEEVESYLKSPVVQQTLRSIREENPEQYEQTLVEIAKAEFAKEVEAKEAALLKRIEGAEQAAQEVGQRTVVKQGIEAAFNKVRAEGGLSAELVEEFQNRGMDSHIGRMMQTDPQRFYTERGSEDAVRILESTLRSRIAQAKQQETAQAVQGTVTSAGTGTASTRGVNLNEKPETKTAEEEYLEMVENAGTASKNLGFL